MLFVPASLCALCVITCLLIRVASNHWSIYVEPDIPDFAKADTVRSTYTWGDTGLNYFIWRKQILVGSRSPGLDTWDSIVKYYDKYLTAQGWKLYENKSFTPCNAYMPETQFLPLGQNGYVYYRRPEATNYRAASTVCLAVFRTESGFFYVVLQTVNPSFLAYIASEFD